MQNFIVAGVIRHLISEVLLAIHTDGHAHCVVIGGSPQTRILRFSNLCSAYDEQDFHGGGYGDRQFVACVNRFAHAMPDPVLIAADTDTSRILNRVRAQLTPRVAATPANAALDLLDNKWRFYQFGKAQRLNVPDTVLCGSKEALDFGALAGALGLPFVVKPLSEAASNGVHAIYSAAELEQKIVANPHYRHAPLIVQRFIPGIDVGLNLAATGGRLTALAIQQRVVQPRVGSKIKFIRNDYLADAAHTIAAACNYDGVMNVDARIARDSGDVLLFESNPRFWRTLSASVWCGINFVSECVEPGTPARGLRTLSSGYADTYYHPLFRPSQWRAALFDRGPHGRMVRVKMRDPYTLATSAMTLLRARMAHDSQIMALCEA